MGEPGKFEDSSVVGNKQDSRVTGEQQKSSPKGKVKNRSGRNYKKLAWQNKGRGVGETLNEVSNDSMDVDFQCGQNQGVVSDLNDSPRKIQKQLMESMGSLDQVECLHAKNLAAAVNQPRLKQWVVYVGMCMDWGTTIHS